MPSDCPGSDTLCQTRTCSGAGVCGVAFTPANTPVGTQTAGDCKSIQCDGAGTQVVVNADADLPVDGNECTADVCTNGTPSNPPVAVDTTCSQNGGSFCNATAQCVQCNQASQCAGSDTLCQARTCSGAGVCGVAFTPANTPVGTQTAGDCKSIQCDGAGTQVVVNADADLPVDGNECTADVCTNGTPSNPPVAVNTTCSQNGGAFCNATAQCVQCNQASQCPGSDTACQARTCSGAGVCGTSFTPAMVAAGSQTAGDCKQNQCDGFGAPVVVNTDSDVPVDGNECTADVCSNGVPSNPPQPVNTTCSQNGGAFCNATAQCVQCNQASQCPGSDTECRTRTCSGAGVCGADFTPAMTAVATQTAGDCKQNECDGFGSPVVANFDSDLPVDGNQCTNDVCTSGVPSNPPQPVNTACSQNGGAFCDGAAACVQCNQGSQCPGSDTECQARTCSGNTCGFSFTASGTPVAAQTAGDCKRDECDGSGGVVSVNFNADLPVDGNQCTNDVCTGGVPSNPPAPVNTACTQNGGAFCDGAASCVQCNQGSQCPGSDTECQARTCSGNTCGFSYTASGTSVSSQTSGDCKRNQCDGSGNTVAVNDNADVPLDGNQCTDDVCTAGVPSNPPSAVGTACNQNGGSACDGASACVPPPTVVSTTPANAATPVAGGNIAVTFSTAMNPATLTGQTAAGACSGSVQVSVNDFASCVAFSSASAAMSGGNTIATFTPAPGLLVNRTYKIRVTTAAKASTGLGLASTFTHAAGFTTTSPNICDASVVISQIFGGGGSSGTVPNADYVELHNRGSTAVTMTNWSIQYASTSGTSWSVNIFSGTIAPGGYFLVRVQTASATGTTFTPDAVGSISVDMSGSNGKVALVSSTTSVGTASCPAIPVVDFVGYGTANCREGATSAPAGTSSTALFRASNGCADVNQNSAEFTTAAPAPRNAASAALVCACTIQNESNAALEADYCVVQFPLSMSVATATTTPLVFGQLFEAGVTEAAGANPNVRAQLGYGSPSTNPQYQSWSWFNASFNTQVGNNDEYQASFTAPAPGPYRYAYRFSLDQGVSWTVCDQNAGDFGSGSNAGLTFELADLPVLTVTP